MSVSKGLSPRSIVGISLIEVLVALVIFSVGALGLMKLQQQAIQSTESADWHSQAMSLARDIVERIRANPAARSIYETADWQTPTAVTCTQWNYPCSPTELAQADIAEISAQAKNSLPTAHVQITPCLNATCVAVSWLNSAEQCSVLNAQVQLHCSVMTF